MPTDYKGLDPEILETFETAYPPSDHPDAEAEIRALESLFGRPMPAEFARLLQTERDPVLAPTPAELASMEHPFEALILRAQELDDCVSVLFPLTGSVYMRRFLGKDLLGHIPGTPDLPVMPFVGWRRDKWAYDLPSLLRIAMALQAFQREDDAEVEELLAPVWGRIASTEFTEQMFYTLEDNGAAARMTDAWGDKPDLRRALRQWWRHERALFFGFALIGKFREPETNAFTNDPKKGLANEHLTRNLGLQMSLLWRGWFLPEGDLLEQAMAATESSPSLLVQDARRLIAELLDGRKMIGSVDMHEGRANYKTWVDDPAGYAVFKRARRRDELEGRLEPSEHGIELVRAEWPLQAESRVDRATHDEHTWDPKSRALQIRQSDKVIDHTPPPPPEELKISLAQNNPISATSPSTHRFVCNASVHRPKSDGSGWENAPMLVEFNRETTTWRQLVDAKNLNWFACIDDDRWVVHDGENVSLVRDLGSEFNASSVAFCGQPRTFHLPELGVVIAYGRNDLVLGRSPEDPKAPWVRVLAYWRERLACIAAFPIDGVELTAKQEDATWKIGLVSADRKAAWEFRGLAEGTAAWRAASEIEEKEEREKREAFGAVTVGRAVEALNTFLGTEYGPEYQEGLDAGFAGVLEALRNDTAAVAAAKEAANPIEFAPTIKAPLSAALTNAGRGPAFLDFALKCTILVPAYADVVVRAAATSAWETLRG